MAEKELGALARSLGVVMDVRAHGLRTERWPGSRDWQHYAYTITLTRETAPAGPYRFERPYKMGTGLKGGPALADVLYSLLSDAQSGEYDFADFCSEFGYDEDSRRAYASWETCCDTRTHMTRMFADEEIERLQRAAEDM